MQEPPYPQSYRIPPPAHDGPVDPKLTKSLIANYEALQNDLKQATEMAKEYQRQLAGKSNELAYTSQVFERTQQHLQRLEVGIEELRDERHRLANEAMRVTALEQKLESALEENQKLRAHISAMQHQSQILAQQQTQREREHAQQQAHLEKQHAERDQEREALIQKLTQETEALRKLVSAQPGHVAATGGEPHLRPHVKAQMPTDTYTIDINYGGTF